MLGPGAQEQRGVRQEGWAGPLGRCGCLLSLEPHGGGGLGPGDDQLGPPTCWSSFWEGSLGTKPASCTCPSAMLSWAGPGDPAEIHVSAPTCRAGILSQTSCLHAPSDGQLTTSQAASAPRPPPLHRSVQREPGGTHLMWAALKLARQGSPFLYPHLWPQSCPVLGLLLPAPLSQHLCQVPSHPTHSPQPPRTPATHWYPTCQAGSRLPLGSWGQFPGGGGTVLPSVLTGGPTVC